MYMKLPSKIVQHNFSTGEEKRLDNSVFEVEDSCDHIESHNLKDEYIDENYLTTIHWLTSTIYVYSSYNMYVKEVGITRIYELQPPASRLSKYQSQLLTLVQTYVSGKTSAICINQLIVFITCPFIPHCPVR